MSSTRKIIEINEERCDGCGQCAVACAEGAIEIVNGKAKLVSDVYCDGLGACLGECPQGALRIIEREAGEFDPAAVEQYLEERKKAREAQHPAPACGCPSTMIRIMAPKPAGADLSSGSQRIPSALTHWPVQIRLVPAKAPFLKGAHLLVAADCTPVAYPDFHRDFLKDRVVLLGCPKFDHAPEYIKRFEEIFREADIQSVTVLDMEVPCCSALPVIVKRGMDAAGKKVPLEEIVLGVGGEILRKNLSAG